MTGTWTYESATGEGQHTTKAELIQFLMRRAEYTIGDRLQSDVVAQGPNGSRYMVKYVAIPVLVEVRRTTV
jgi:hypothetical protein